MTNPPGQGGWGQEPPYGQPDYSAPGQPPAQPPGYGQPPVSGQPGQPGYDPYGQPVSGPPPQYGEYGQTAQYGQQGFDQYGQPQQQPQQYDQPPQYGEYGQTAQYPAADQQPGYGYPTSGVPGAPPTQAMPAYGDPAYGQPAYGQPPYGAPPVPPKKGKGPLIAILAVVGVVLLLCVGGGIFAVTQLGGDDNDTATPRSSTSAGASSDPSASADDEPSDGPSVEATNKIGSRSTDDEPLTVSELRESSYTGQTTGAFTPTGTDESSNCTSAVDSRAAGAVAGCSQYASITAVNQANKCVVTFGALNMPDEASAKLVISKMNGGNEAGSFVPRRHGNALEGQAGAPATNWYFFMQQYGHWVAFATGAFSDGKSATTSETIRSCDKDMLTVVLEKLSERG